MSKTKVRCITHDDCFANKRGTCACLTDNNFKDDMCPFYKTKAQNDYENKKVKQRLINAGRTDLIEKYKGSIMA